ncbi:MAG TPA: Mur ligase family protein, partial [Emticicia sp.]
FAVLETARGGILRAGLAFEQSDIGIITNIQEDHLGISDIHTLDDLTRVKSIIIESVKKEGWGILNADNEYCVRVGKETTHCNIAYFSMDENNPVITEHCKNGGIAAIQDNGYISIKKGEWKIRVDKVTHVPITYNGTLSFMTQNALAATLATFLWGFKIEDIRLSLESFIPSAVHNPGRMNLFDFKDYKILVDYAHNPDGLRGLKNFLNASGASYHTGVISGTGDRRDDDIREIGRISASMFNEIVICQEKYLRGRTYEELVSLLTEGVKEVAPDLPLHLITTSNEAWNFIISKVRPGEMITIVSDSIVHAAETVRQYHDKIVAYK